MRTARNYLVIAWFLGFPWNLCAHEMVIKAPPEIIKSHVWIINFSGLGQHFRGTKDFDFNGNSGQIGFGYGYISERWMGSVLLHLINGPFDLSRDRPVILDYQGTGFDASLAFGAPDRALRDPQGGYGFMLGMNYTDFGGRGIGANRNMPADTYSPLQLGLTQGHRVRVTSLTLAPGIFFCWLEPARTDGIKLEQLMTRIEGYMLGFSVAVPVLSSYSVSYTQRVLQDAYKKVPTADLEKLQQVYWQDVPATAKGKLKGYSLVLSFAVMLGV